MPYIKKESREKWEGIVSLVNHTLDSVPLDKKEGELNYLITKIIKKTYRPSYFEYNRAIGMLECIKQEFYRRCVGKYEDTKKQENGDV